jgi:hypothetical protein
MQEETMSDRAKAAQIHAVNGRLKKSEGWIGYRFSTVNGEKVPSKFLYFAFYVNGTQKFVNTKTNDAEDAYRQLLGGSWHCRARRRGAAFRIWAFVLRTSSRFLPQR